MWGTCTSKVPSVSRICLVIRRAKSEVAGPRPPSFHAPSIWLAAVEPPQRNPSGNVFAMVQSPFLFSSILTMGSSFWVMRSSVVMVMTVSCAWTNSREYSMLSPLT